MTAETRKEATSKLALRQLQEITGATEEQAIQAIQLSGGDLTNAVSILSNALKCMTNDKVTPATGLPNENEPTKDKSSSKEVIEISDEKDEGLARAIALSLQEASSDVGGSVSAEDKEISRALEASLAENKSGQKRKRGSVWLTFTDPENPHDRERVDSTPVGLKNVGNTCWFSAVIQSLFHLPKFRHLILSHVCKDSEDNRELKPKSNFLAELQHLFALLLNSKRKYVDPTKPIEILQEALRGNGSDSNTDQQDVSEFTHVLLDWLEESFQKPPENGVTATNPISAMFYGSCKSSGPGFDRKETFSSFPLCVRDSPNLHDSIDNSLVTSASDTSAPGERWFTRLPSVLTFELSRFQFNKLTSRTEKIHDALQFDDLIYLERYMEKSKAATREKRRLVEHLRVNKNRLSDKLSKYDEFGSTKSNIANTFDSLLKFLNTSRERDNTEAMDVSPCSSPTTRIASECTTDTLVIDKANRVHGPAPSLSSAAERGTVKSCIDRWRQEAVADMAAIKEGITLIDRRISLAYDSAAFKKSPYRLHAILVHEGQASGGHYWAYVYDASGEHWRKFNDVQVTDVTWDEIVRDSVGGYRNASAYCLIYVDANDADLFSSRYNCPPRDALSSVVAIDNEAFVNEVIAWDAKDPTAKSKIADQTADTGNLKLPATPRPADEQADGRVSLTEELKSLVQHHYDCLENVALNVSPSSDTDNRLLHFVIYLIHCQAPRAVIERCIMERFIVGKESMIKRPEVQLQVISAYIARLCPTEADERQYEEWKRRHANFLEANLCFIRGVELTIDKKHCDALGYFSRAAAICSEQATDFNAAGPLSQTMVKEFQRSSVVRTNDEAIALFGGGSPEMNWKGQDMVCNLVVPCCRQLSASNDTNDARTADDLRQRWFALLSADELDGVRRSILEEILTKLVQEDCQDTTPLTKQLPLLPELYGPQLLTCFARVMKAVRSANLLQH